MSDYKKEYQRNYYLRNKEKRLQYFKDYYMQNRESIKKRNDIRRRKIEEAEVNPVSSSNNKKADSYKEYYEKHKEERKEYYKKHYRKNKEDRQKYYKEYYLKKKGENKDGNL